VLKQRRTLNIPLGRGYFLFNFNQLINPSMSLAELLASKKKGLKVNPEGTLVRTKEGNVYQEKIVDGKLVQTDIGKLEFVPIEAAPDPKVCKIQDFLFLGSQDAAANIAELESFKITHILNVATGIENAFPKEFIYCNVEILDVDEASIVDCFPKCFAFIESAVNNNTGVLVHCNAGVSRSASVVIGYLMKVKRISYAEAFDIVKEKRSKIQPNRGFIEQLQIYEKQLGYHLK